MMLQDMNLLSVFTDGTGTSLVLCQVFVVF